LETLLTTSSSAIMHPARKLSSLALFYDRLSIPVCPFSCSLSSSLMHFRSSLRRVKPRGYTCHLVLK
jgi:hypothetical protein